MQPSIVKRRSRTIPQDALDLVFAAQRRRIAVKLATIERRIERVRRTGRARKCWSTDV